MKILFVTHDYTRTGAPISLLRLIDSFFHSKVNIEIHIATIYERGDKTILEKFKQVSNHYVGNVKKLKRGIFTRSHYDLIFLNTIVGGEIVKDLRAFSDSIISWIHENPFTIESYGVHLLTNLIEHSTQIWAVNSIIYDYILEKGANSLQIYTELCASSERAKSSEVILPSSEIGSKLKIACAGLPVWRKGIYDIPQVITNAEQSLHFITWFGANKTDNGIKEVEYTLNQLNLSSKFVVGGVVPDLAKSLESFDLFLMLSHEDPFPLVCLEAASVGVPTMCWDKGTGIVDFVKDDGGWIVPYQNFVALSTFLERVMQQREIISRKGEIARERVKQHFPDVKREEFLQLTGLKHAL